MRKREGDGETEGALTSTQELDPDWAVLLPPLQKPQAMAGTSALNLPTSQGVQVEAPPLLAMEPELQAEQEVWPTPA